MNGFINRSHLMSFLTVCTVTGVLLFASESLAAETTSKGRIIWNNIMLFVNFGILVFLFIKFAKNPLMDFLHGESKKISKDITDIEAQVREARSLMDSEAAKLEGIEERIKEIKEQILEAGTREKEKIIEKAKAAARQMIEGAEKEAQYKLDTAKRRFSEEMLDLAISMAVEKLKEGFTQEDNEMIIDKFSEGLGSEKRHFA